ncbi:sigma-54-dependent Fis family transcriptional regulator, partial [candidate division WOR-3 bacterium]|nr:sigma-54-dependent Fis family transcriptional regulator [candidate division WOR-3 bacterium]
NWPGNIREMGNLIERVIVNQDKMIIDALPIFKDERGLKEKVKVVTKEMEIDEIKSALIKTAGNKSKAAKILKISYRNLLDKIKEYEINE